MTYFIDLRADSVGGTPVASIDAVTIRTETQLNPNPSISLAPDMLQSVQGRDVLLGTHGFHVNRADGISNLSHWAEWLATAPNGVFLGVLWPGDSKWIPFLDYPVEGNEAIKSGQLLAAYLAANFAGAASISLASHSLGARVVLETIRRLPSSIRVNALILMAGAIDDNCLSNEYRDAVARVGKISVLASQCDDVLKWAFPLGNPLSGILTRGDPYWHAALGRTGPTPPDQPANLVKAPILPNSWDFGHFSYINTTGQIGSPGESGRFALPAVVQPEGSPRPSNAKNWQPAWAAGFASTRWL
jgi:pimeloyl-ACP methyl ester carboxylesterase